MARTQKNKATSYHLGQLKAKLAKLKRELLMPTSGGGGGGGSKGLFNGLYTIKWLTICQVGFDVAKTGVARVGFVGMCQGLHCCVLIFC